MLNFRSRSGVRSVASTVSFISSARPVVCVGSCAVVVERSIEDELEGQVFEILRARENSAACVCQNLVVNPARSRRQATYYH